MAIPLRYSTASQEVPLGYFVDSEDGDTAETGLTIANSDIRVWKAGATTLANKNSGGATHIAGGIYYAVLDATDTNTLGPLVLFVHVAGALSVRVECVVYAQAVYDSLFGSGDLPAKVNDIDETVIASAELEEEALEDIASAVRTELTTELARLDAAVSTRMATFSYTAPDNVGIAAASALAAKLETMLEADGETDYMFTEEALVNAPAGEGGGGPTLAQIWSYNNRTLTDKTGFSLTDDYPDKEYLDEEGFLGGGII